MEKTHDVRLIEFTVGGLDLSFSIDEEDNEDIAEPDAIKPK